MDMNIYANSIEEFDNKIQEYQFHNYRITKKSQNQVVLKNRGYNMAVFIILLILFVIPGLIYILLSSENVVTITLSPQTRADDSNNDYLVKNKSVANKKYCVECGNPIEENDKFCRICGKKF